MTSQEWLGRVRQQSGTLERFIGDWHPSSHSYDDAAAFGMTITAPAAQTACDIVSAAIARNEKNDNPVGRFWRAVAEGDCRVIISLLDQAWFGVPESTECWSIEGFREAVGILENAPDDIEYDEDDGADWQPDGPELPEGA
jgi:hypothetical protein